MKRLSAVVMLLAALVLTGCGFHLRRELSLPEELRTIRIESSDAYSTLTHGLTQSLRRAGATVVETAADETPIARLRIGRSEVVQRPLSVGSTGRVQEFALEQNTQIELIDARGTIRVPAQTVSLQRVFSFDGAAALGTPGEEETVRTELEREMVSAVLRRIEAALRD